MLQHAANLPSFAPGPNDLQQFDILAYRDPIMDVILRSGGHCVEQATGARFEKG
jgi:hypothetical protein